MPPHRPFDAIYLQIDRYQWAYMALTGTNTTSNSLAAAISSAGSLSSPLLTVPGSLISDIPTGNHTVQLTVTNFLGVTSATTFTLVKVAGEVRQLLISF